MTYVLHCWACNERREFDELHRGDYCDKCDADLKSCKQCRHYDENSSGECKETMAEHVYKKERANFCAYFSVRVIDNDASENEVMSAREKLDALFKS